MTETTRQVKKDHPARFAISFMLLGALIGGLIVFLTCAHINITTADLKAPTTTSRSIKQVQKEYPNFDFPDQANLKRANSNENLIGNSFYAVDTKTGVEYLVTNRGGITPRLDKHGRVMIVKNLK